MYSRRKSDPLQDRVYAFYKEKNKSTDPYSERWTPYVAQVCAVSLHYAFYSVLFGEVQCQAKVWMCSFSFSCLAPPPSQSMIEHRNKLFIVLCAQQRPPNFRERKLQQRKHLLNLTSLLIALLCICSDSLSRTSFAINTQSRKYRTAEATIQASGW